MRLESVIPDIIHPDQTGFLKVRHFENHYCILRCTKSIQLSKLEISLCGPLQIWIWKLLHRLDPNIIQFPKCISENL